jgi:hypothetical protein
MDKKLVYPSSQGMGKAKKSNSKKGNNERDSKTRAVTE